MTQEEMIQIINDALNTYGIVNQQWMLVEECSELLNAIGKNKRKRVNVETIITKLADVSIMIDQMAYFYGIDDFLEEREKKILRLKERLNKHKEQ